ncbi:MAG: Gfo/Idh/MocA family oxidoreductase [Planctomycetota bacterium]
MARERAVVVGAGGISGAWFPPLQREKVRILGVVDLDMKKAEAAVERYGLDCKASTDLKTTLKKTKPDFVCDLTVPEAHCAVTCTALKAGCHVVGEKPMANSMAEARKMVRTSALACKMYMVSQSRRWEMKHAQIEKAVAGGRLGTLTTVNCDFYIGAHFGGFRDVMPSPLILDMAIHHFDLARYITGEDPVAVYAREFNPKGSWYKGDVAASCIFEMTNGVIFTYRGSWCAEGCSTSWHGDWRFIGDKGTLLYDHDGEPHGQVIAKDEGFVRAMKDLKVPDATMKYGGMHGALREMLRFLRTGKMSQCECHDNIKSLAMVFGVIESSRKGQRVPVRAL